MCVGGGLSAGWRGSGLTWAGAVLASILVSGPAVAGNISLQLSATTRVQDGQLAVQLSVRNTGDEAAHSLTPTLHFRDRSAQGAVRPLLRPNESLETELTLAAGDLGTGRWPYRIMVAYADANAYPLNALHVGLALVGTAPPGKLGVLDVAADPLATTGPMRLRLKNLSKEPRRVAVNVYLPEGIELLEAVPAVELAAWEERTVTTRVVNRTGLPGSRYAVFVSAEYDVDDVHQAVLVPSTVEIVASQSVVGRWRTPLWIAAGVLTTGWIVFIVWRLAARRRTPAGGSLV